MSDRPAIHRLLDPAFAFLTDVRSIARDSAELVRQTAATSRMGGQIGWPLAIGAGLVSIGTVLVCLMTVHFLVWAFPEQPLWAAYAEVGVALLATGTIFLLVARKRLQEFDRVKTQSARIMEDAANAADHAGETVDAARQSLDVAAETAREIVDWKEQFDKHPWAVLAGTIALGYAGGSMLKRDGPRGGPSGEADSLARHLEPELTRLKGLAIGALFGILRDAVTKSTAEPVEHELEEVIDDITAKLGGTPVHGPVLNHSHGNGSSQARIEDAIR